MLNWLWVMKSFFCCWGFMLHQMLAVHYHQGLRVCFFFRVWYVKEFVLDGRQTISFFAIIPSRMCVHKNNKKLWSRMTFIFQICVQILISWIQHFFSGKFIVSCMSAESRVTQVNNIFPNWLSKTEFFILIPEMVLFLLSDKYSITKAGSNIGLFKRFF